MMIDMNINTPLLSSTLRLVSLLLVALSSGVAWSPLYASIGWGSTHVRYPHKPSQGELTLDTISSSRRAHSLTLWRGETGQAQLVVSNDSDAEALYEVKVDNLRAQGGRGRINKRHIELGWVDEVIADRFSNCGTHELEQYGRVPSADRIVLLPKFTLPPGEQRGVWLSIRVPHDTPAGSYAGDVRVLRQGCEVERLSLRVEVQNRLLPPASEWRYHLDFWQNPYAIARWHQVAPWSKQHFEVMRPYMERLARAGQKVITATLIDRPWNGQTYDAFGSMVEWRRRADGQWEYDFDVFDRWVEFMLSCGVSQQISCFSMIPWRLSFRYYDEASRGYQHWEAAPGEALYEERWGHFLSAFAQHLKAKGWLERTTISMDERSLEHMQAAIALIHRYAPGLGISMAGYYHPEIEADLVDYCIDQMSPQQYTSEVLQRRKSEGKISTYYTCCSAQYPNTFTFSPPAEAAFISWYALRRGLDGYLRWAYNSWPEDPVRDSRFTAWSSGDTYIVYPEAYPSVRWAMLTEGIQQWEKYHILRREAEAKGDTARLEALEALLDLIDISKIETDLSSMVEGAQARLASLSW